MTQNIKSKYKHDANVDDMTALDNLADLGERFQGVDLKFRRDGTVWEKKWKAECFSSKHEGARFCCYGSTHEEAIANLLKEVKARMGDS